ncbi:hypothetical protein BB560_002262 [Smittium megazygosporum]|nr:hypothetical protein BB560_002261 [Smittium megazygosporum]PVV03266.1 hypothetical protein BB560_002262 [Smittium megazygosporum]
MEDIKQLTLEDLKDILPKDNLTLNPKVRSSPMVSLYRVSKQLLETSLNSVPLVDIDTSTKRDVVVANLTTYQVLQFMASNIKEKELLSYLTLEHMNIGTYGGLSVVNMKTPVIEIISLFVDNDVSVVPIIDESGTLINAFDRSDLKNFIRHGMLNNLEMPVEEAIQLRSSDYSGVHTCKRKDNLWSVLTTVRNEFIYRLIVIDDDTKPIGIITLSDILKSLIK